MGNQQTRPFKNYGLTIVPQTTLPLISNPGEAYKYQLVDEKYEVDSYGLKSKTQINTKNMRSGVYSKPDAITLLTYNVWFQAHNMQNRYDCIMRMIADSNADFICLQEVNSNFLNLLHQSSKQFQGSDYFMPVTKMHWYDTLILSKYPCRFYKKDYQVTGMGRSNLMAVVEFSLPNTQSTFKLAINCTHLESLNSQTQRVAQLEEIQALNKNMDMNIIAGDFNFSDGWPEGKALKNSIDVWKVGKRTFSQWANEEMRQTGYTMPPTTQFPPWRPDHIVYRSKYTKLIGQHEIGIIGDFTLPPYEEEHYSKVAQDGMVRTPSDHFALISKIYIPS